MSNSDMLHRVVKARMKVFQKSLLSWTTNHLRSYPWREQVTPYRILIAEFLLRRTTSKAVERIYESFINRYPDCGTLAGAETSELEVSLKPIGFHKQRARMLHEMMEYIEENLGGRIPESYDTLLGTPNVGPYIAGAVLSLAYGLRFAMVDTNVERIISRIFKHTLPKRGRFRRVQGTVEVLLPQESVARFNLGLLDLGALVCSYRWTKCDICPLNAICDYYDDLQSSP
jgi:A/G-specific adenine glycosylase